MFGRVNPLQYPSRLGCYPRDATESRPYALLMAVKVAMGRNADSRFRAGALRSFFNNLNDRRAPIDRPLRTLLVDDLRAFVANELKTGGRTERRELLGIIKVENRIADEAAGQSTAGRRTGGFFSRFAPFANSIK